MSNRTNYGTAKEPSELQVYANVATVLAVGAALCFDRSASVVADRNHTCIKPTLGSLSDLAGVVVEQGKHATVGPKDMAIIPIGYGIERGVQVLTDENVAVGDYLGPIPGSHYFGKCATGHTCFRATEAVDGSTTPALVTGDFGWAIRQEPELKNKLVEFFDHFIGQSSVGIKSVAAGASLAPTWNQIGTNVVVTMEDGWGPEKTTAATTGSGVISLLTVTTTNCQLRLSGEPFRLDAGKALFFQTRVAHTTITDGDFFAGLSLGADTSIIAGHNDAIGFYSVDGAVTFKYQKGASGEITVSSVGTMVAAEFAELSFLVRNRGSATGAKTVSIWFNGTLIAHTTTEAEVSDDQSLTAVFEVIGDDAQTLLIDRVRIGNAL